MTAGNRVRRKVRHLRERNADPHRLHADVREHRDAYTVIFDAPGVDHEDVRVRYVDGRVWTRIERLRDAYEGFDLVAGGRPLALDGEVELPDDAIVTPEASEAMLRADGTLHIRLPKQEATTDAHPPRKLAE